MTDRLKILLAIGTMSGGGSERQLLGVLKYLDRTRFEPCLYLISREGELLSEIPDDVRVISFWDRHQAPKLNYPGALYRKTGARFLLTQFVKNKPISSTTALTT